MGGGKLGVGIFRFGYVVCMVLGDVGAYGFRRGGFQELGFLVACTRLYKPLCRSVGHDLWRSALLDF